MRRRWFVGGALAGLAALLPGVTDAKKRRKEPPVRAPEPGATLAAKVKRLETRVAELERRVP